MKIRSILLTLAVVTTGGSVWSQGTIQFCNSTPGEYAPVIDWWTRAPIAPDPDLVVMLYVGQTTDSLAPVGAMTHFTSPGVFGEGLPATVVSLYPPGRFVFFEVRMWDSHGGTLTSYEDAIQSSFSTSTVKSEASFVTLGDASSPLAAPGLVGLQPFFFPVPIPEPSSWAMLGLGLGVLGFQYRSRR